MKNIITLTILLIIMIGCSENKTVKNEQTGSTNIALDGFWFRSSSDFDFRQAIQQMDCSDPEAIALYEPYALGTHFLIKGDSILFFRYPYQYYGTFKYELLGDSLFIESDFGIAHTFSIQKNNEDTVSFNFTEEITSTCSLIAKADYERFTPDSAIINQLIKDSISYNALVEKWWYLRKEIGSNDGSEPNVLNFPKGMPDSLFISKEIINQAIRHPVIRLKLHNRTVEMLIKNLNEYSYTLSPQNNKDKILFSDFINYGKRIDTIYYDVVYRKNK